MARRMIEANSKRQNRHGFTLIEVMVTMAVIGVLIASSATLVVRTVEQAYVDYAGSGLHAVWNAQRLYWVEHRTYALDIATLQAEGMLVESLDSQRYQFTIASATDDQFTVEAARVGSERWNGSLLMDESGVVTGVVSDGTHNLEPAL